MTKSTDSEYGSADQTQEVTYDVPSQVTKNISKSASWDENNNQMSYSVLVNPDAADFLDGSDYLSFLDKLQTCERPDDPWGIYAALQNDSVIFYEVSKATQENGDYVYGDVKYSENPGSFIVYDGVVYYIVGTLNIAWTYSEEVSELNSGNIYTWHYISATIPDETAILVQYTYNITVVSGGGSSGNAVTGWTNTARVSGGYTDSLSNQSGEYYSDAGYAAGVSAANSLTLLKVDSTDNTDLLDGAVFTLYKYDSSASDGWTDTGVTFTTVDGVFSVTKDSLKQAGVYTAATMYKLVETTAPSGYILDSDTVYYFYWSEGATVIAQPASFSETSYDLSTVGETVYAENTAYTALALSETVTKKWLDENGIEITSDYPVEEVEVGLYQSAVTKGRMRWC